VNFDQDSYEVHEHSKIVKPVLLLSGPAYFDISVHIFSVGIDASG